MQLIAFVDDHVCQVYSRSLAASVFTGLEMDLVSYSMELLQSDDEKEVLGGLKILKTFVERQHDFQGDTLRRIGIAPGQHILVIVTATVHVIHVTAGSSSFRSWMMQISDTKDSRSLFQFEYHFS